MVWICFLENKHAVITGGGYGIGEAIARTLAREGAAVLLAARSEAKLEAVAKSINESGGRAGIPEPPFNHS